MSIPFRTDATPRIDALFGDATTLRAALDGFLALQGQMDAVREEFSTAVHQTLAALPAGATSAPGKATARVCPSAVPDAYGRALGAGGRFLALGHQLQSRYREIRRGDDSGDSAGLTPDYRWKARRVREQYARLLADYRERRVAFHDQLGAELRHAGCKAGDRSFALALASRRSPAPPPVAADDQTAPDPLDSLDPLDPEAWSLDAVDAPVVEAARPAPAAARNAAPNPSTAAAPAGAMAATPIWIDVDNSLCQPPTRVTIDGQPMGDVAGRASASIRTRAGPHEVCVLPTTDQRPCGAPGTIRKAYLHEGWSLTVHCAR